jgi:putative PIN family toxin of toxin-antitoxin system
MNKERWRIVFNTNIFVAGMLSKNPTSPNKELLERWRAGQFTLLTSRVLMLEVIEKLDERGIDRLTILDLISRLNIAAEKVELNPSDVLPVISEDADDDHVLACAVVGNADYILTYDPHFDVLGSSYKGIQIVEPIPFLFRLRRHLGEAGSL